MIKYAVIVAGGSGTRMGGDLPKQFMLLKDKPVLYYTLKVFLESYDDLQVILVLPIDYTDMGQEIIDACFEKDRIRITAGGASHALIDSFIRDQAGKELVLDFEGSDLRNLAFFYSSFGAKEEKYAGLKWNKLPFYIRFFKK